MDDKKNLFAEAWNTPHNTIPFDKVTTELLEKAIQEGMRREDDEITSIVENTNAPSFERSGAHFSFSFGQDLSRF